MANIVVVSECDMGCSYCFARGQLRARLEGGYSPFISLPDFEQRLDFLDRSRVDEVRLIGGEPTLHPEFAELIRLARNRRKRIVLFTHGLLSESALDCLSDLTVDDCTIIVNSNASLAGHGPTAEEHARRRKTLERLGPRALLGFTIDRVASRMDPLIELIKETGCRRLVRIGLSQPAPSGANTYLNPKQYPAIGRAIASFARAAAQAGVRVSFDCGFVRCMFTDAELSALVQAQADLAWRCSPILDIDLSGQALHCFPLSHRLQVPVDDSTDAGSLRQALAAQARPYRLAGVYRECSSCSIRRTDGCSGGCLAVTMRRFRSAPAGLLG